ncbi:MAG: response regulator [Bacteroidia bacterium]|nr:response regulator [Bacteroidia bacterium]NNC86454.1 response regulator [Bacteroidia bacterium]NNM16687.1 response regulator [Bacteroidia bacterium]
MSTTITTDSVNLSPKEVKYQNVLIIDDNPIDVKIHETLISATKFAKNITSFNIAKEAVAYLESVSIENAPDVILLDIIMPEMDGFQFLEAYAQLSKELHKKCKVVLLSTSDSFKDLNRANKSPFVQKFLNKPLTDNVLVALNV